jgi:hypothetical protein
MMTLRKLPPFGCASRVFAVEKSLIPSVDEELDGGVKGAEGASNVFFGMPNS